MDIGQHMSQKGFFLAVDGVFSSSLFLALMTFMVVTYYHQTMMTIEIWKPVDSTNNKSPEGIFLGDDVFCGISCFLFHPTSNHHINHDKDDFQNATPKRNIKRNATAPNM